MGSSEHAPAQVASGALEVLRDRRVADDDEALGLRERKKRRTRQQISDVATTRFLDRGFDEVKVAEIAEACGVSEKTVYNYFPTKESLVLGREEAMREVVRRSLGPEAPAGSPVEAFVAALRADLVDHLHQWEPDPEVDEQRVLETIRRFHDMVESTPSLRAAHRDASDRLRRVAAAAIAARAGVDPSEPEPQIAAAALVALLGVQWTAIRRFVDDGASLDEVISGASEEVARAARLVDTGLWSFGLVVQGTTSVRQFNEAAGAANVARKQVVVSVKAAKAACGKGAEPTAAHQPAARVRAESKGAKRR